MNAWICPRCELVNAPTAQQCTCRPADKQATPVPAPVDGVLKDIIDKLVPACDPPTPYKWEPWLQPVPYVPVGTRPTPGECAPWLHPTATYCTALPASITPYCAGSAF